MVPFISAIEVIRKNNPTSKILVMTATRQCPMSGTTIRRKDTDKKRYRVNVRGLCQRSDIGL